MRRDLQETKDSEVRHPPATTALLDRSEDDPFATIPPPAPSAGDGLRFRVLRPHARGGLGQVSVAVDEELHREVAFKEIRECYADDPHRRARFLLEAEVTGGLEHPGIVPVYGLGQFADGRPFYAMRFIKGESLGEAIQRFHAKRPVRSAERGEPVASLEFRRLLARFVDVCNAIEYAHSRGVLHRDLKPSNVMLGKYGETLVVDWGLAKATGRAEPMGPDDEPALRPSSASGSALTQMGRTIGTPAFMSPEQAAGRLDLLGPATDIYSLGATLGCLLTGRAVFESGDETRDDAPDDRIVPRQAHGGVPPVLDAICRKAMARVPAGRYRSARALADDVERYLADEPVSVLPETFARRSARWGRRHRAIMHSGAAALSLVAVVSAAAAVVVHGAHRHESAARAKIEQALLAEMQAKHEVKQALAAQTEAKHAAKRALAAETEAKHEAKRALAAEVEARHEAQRAFTTEIEAMREARRAVDQYAKTLHGDERFTANPGPSASVAKREKDSRLSADE